MNKLLNHPVSYCAVGILLAAVPSIRATWWGLLILGSLVSAYGHCMKDKAEITNRHEVGDNCYFIGFVYTLAVITLSLAFDAETLLSQGGLGQLLTTVGIALGTSVIGMLWRFGLTHEEKPPEDEFDRAVRKAAASARTLGDAVERANECVIVVEKSMSQAANAMKAYSERTEEESHKIGRSMNSVAEKLLEDFGKKITDTLQTTHFDGVREALQAAVGEHRAAVSRVNEALSQSLAELNEAAKVSVANVEGVKRALSSLEGAVGGRKWTAMNNALQTFAEGVDNLNGALQTLAERQTAAANEADQDIQRLREMRAAFDGLIRDIHSDAETVAKIKEDYRRAFDKAAQDALEETHHLYGRLIAGAQLALGGIENLGQMSKDLRTIAESMERGRGGE